MPTLDVTQLSEDQLQTSETIFEEIKNLDFLPANEAYRDDTRKLLDRRVLIDLLNLPRIHPRTPRPPTPKMVLRTQRSWGKGHGAGNCMNQRASSRTCRARSIDASYQERITCILAIFEITEPIDE